MLKPYELLENILRDIEKGVKDNINAYILSGKYGFSEGHLRRLFSFAFRQSIAAYIRSRTLAASLDYILETSATICEIAIEYGFEYEQSYIRAFQREFGITPGNLRKTGRIIKIKPPLNLFDENKLEDSVIFGPDIVMVPRFHIIGKREQIPYDDFAGTVPQLGRQFWVNERKQIKGTINPDIFIALTRYINGGKKLLGHTAAVQVKDLKNIPAGFYGDTFETSMCARFRYIGQHHYYDIKKDIVNIIYNAVTKFIQDKHTTYVLSIDKIFFAMIDTKLNDEAICQIEYYTPVSEKQ